MSTIRVLIVDDDQGIRDDLLADLPGQLKDLGELELVDVGSFDEAEKRISTFGEFFDVVVLDVKEQAAGESGKSRGADLFERVRAKSWVPVVFYTGVPHECEGLEAPPLVAVVVKDKPAVLYAAVRAAIESRAAAVARDLALALDARMRDFLGSHVAPNWQSYADLGSAELTAVLATRLAAWMREWSDQGLEGTVLPIGHIATPASYYLQPPVSVTGLRAGSLLEGPEGERWIVLTPTCDLFTDELLVAEGERKRMPKAERVFLAHVQGIATQPAVANYLDAQTKRTRGEVKLVLENHHDAMRWFYLPGFLNIVESVVDLEWVTSVPTGEVVEWERLADLDTPFAEALLARHSHWRGRIGTPDLDVAESLRRITPA